ncbi:2OG-Fe(II) oxygenase family protein [Thalassotalea maritima]|uniref:2OG-Fe(II) oxygenase family protein n=1 Tax=Thalassotalea maritima TaxID=3242416 RepID=UPI00352804DA
MTNLANALQQAATAFSQNNFPLVKQLCQRILSAVSEQPDALHMLAMVDSRLGQHQSAETLFKKALNRQQTNPSLYFNFANHTLAQKKFTDAIKLYQQCIAIDSAHYNAHYNLGIAATHNNQLPLAIKHLVKAVELQPNNANIDIALGIAYKNNDEYKKAIEAFDKAIQNDNQNFNAWFNKGSTLRATGDSAQALACYQQIAVSGEQRADYHFSLGCVYYDLNRFTEAEQSLTRALTIEPEFVLAHETLSKLRWEINRDNDFTSSYPKAKQAISHASLPLTYSYISQLLLSKQYHKAFAESELAIEQFGQTPELLHIKATSYTFIKPSEDWRERCLQWFETCVKMSPNNVRFRIDLASQYIHLQDYTSALAHLQQALNIAPHDQEVWSYMGICWRLTGDDRACWLNDYKRLVKTHTLIAPKGYDNLEHFLAELKGYLTNLHQANKSPLDQSVRQGSQTAGHLLLKSEPIIQQLNHAIEQQVSLYLAELPQDVKHPFLQRNNQRFKIAGSWSVKLKDNGFHSNHIHPAGWLSAPVYIATPDVMSNNDSDKQGWIKFGETSLELANKEQVALSVCPQPGQIIFFPSYMWHGTNPFHAPQSRITTALDIQPR